MTAADIGAIRCGLHSGFPRCCIRFFLGEREQMSEDQRAAYFSSHPSVGYVACPACVAAGNFVQVKRCPVGSHGGNVIERTEILYERVGDRNVITKVEYFYRDRPGSYCLPVVDGQVFYPDDESTP